MRKREGYCRKGNRHKHLHRGYPPALGPDDVHEGTPEGLYHPWKIKKAGEHCHIAFGHAHVREHDHRYVVHYEIRDSFSKIQGGYPPPGIGITISHNSEIGRLSAIRNLLFLCLRNVIVS